MTRQEFVTAFEELSSEDRQAVLAEIIAHGTPKEAAECCSSGPMKDHLNEMMEKMESSENPMAMCQEMMRMCGEKMKQKV